jgi:hypothetical protein
VLAAIIITVWPTVSRSLQQIVFAYNGCKACGNFHCLACCIHVYVLDAELFNDGGHVKDASIDEDAVI